MKFHHSQNVGDIILHGAYSTHNVSKNITASSIYTKKRYIYQNVLEPEANYILKVK